MGKGRIANRAEVWPQQPLLGWLGQEEVPHRGQRCLRQRLNLLWQSRPRVLQHPWPAGQGHAVVAAQLHLAAPVVLDGGGQTQ